MPTLETQTQAWVIETSVLLSNLCLLLVFFGLPLVASTRWWPLLHSLLVWAFSLALNAAMGVPPLLSHDAVALGLLLMCGSTVGHRTVFFGWNVAKLLSGLEELREAEALDEQLWAALGRCAAAWLMCEAVQWMHDAVGRHVQRSFAHPLHARYAVVTYNHR